MTSLVPPDVPEVPLDPDVPELPELDAESTHSPSLQMRLPLHSESDLHAVPLVVVQPNVASDAISPNVTSVRLAKCFTGDLRIRLLPVWWTHDRAFRESAIDLFTC